MVYQIHITIVMVWKRFQVCTSHSCRVRCNNCVRKNCQLQTTRNVWIVTGCEGAMSASELTICRKRQRGIYQEWILPLLCEQNWQYPDCGMNMKTEKSYPLRHECGEVKCLVCNKYYMDDGYKCYRRVHVLDLETDKFVFYDCEWCQEKRSCILNFFFVDVSVN